LRSHFCYQLFNVANFGVPQSRSWVIIVGTRDDLPSEADFVFPRAAHSRVAADKLRPPVSISVGIRGIPDPDTFPDALPNQNYSRYKVTNRNFTGHRTTEPDNPSPTILARGNGGGGVCAIQHPLNQRRLSVRESAAVQTFPHDFEFLGAMNSQYRQVGNAVPVLFGQVLGVSLACAHEKLAALEIEVTQ